MIQPVYQQNAPYPYPTPNTPKSRAPLTLGIVAVILALAVTGVGGYLLLRDKEDPSNSNTVATKDKKQPGAQRISPPEAPYSYELPAGFEELPKSSQQPIVSGSDISIISLKEASEQNSYTDYIAVGVTSSPPTKQSFDSLKSAIESSSVHTNVKEIQVGGNDAFQAEMELSTFTIRYIYILAAGKALPQVTCSWTSAYSTKIEKGCDTVLDSFKLK